MLRRHRAPVDSFTADSEAALLPSPSPCLKQTFCLTVDVEEWFHVLDSPVAPGIEKWNTLESRFVVSTERILHLLEGNGVKATFFWLGWCAQRAPQLVRMCASAGHEIASHGYAHVLAYEAGREAFREDVRKGKSVLEDITGTSVAGFRAAGFSTREDTPWTFEEIRSAGHFYDSSVFPGRRAHGGARRAPLQPHTIDTQAGLLVEIPQSMIEVMRVRLSLFGGGYLRLAPLWLIKRAVANVLDKGRPLIIYVHPREIDPEHPRLPLGPVRRFKSYVNIHTTLSKLRYLCSNGDFQTMGELAARVTPVNVWKV